MQQEKKGGLGYRYRELHNKIRNKEKFNLNLSKCDSCA